MITLIMAARLLKCLLSSLKHRDECMFLYNFVCMDYEFHLVSRLPWRHVKISFKFHKNIHVLTN